jgi:FtsZ-binding cell division protein ZapB
VIAAVEEQARVEQEIIESLRLEIRELKEKITILEKKNIDVKKENADLESRSVNQ